MPDFSSVSRRRPGSTPPARRRTLLVACTTLPGLAAATAFAADAIGLGVLFAACASAGVGGAAVIAAWRAWERSAIAFERQLGRAGTALTRRGLEDALPAEVRRASLLERFGALAVIEVDGLQQLAIEHGRRDTDDLVARCGQALERELRSIDLAARLEGGAWAVLMPDMDRPPLERAEQLRSALEQAANHGCNASLSCGIASFPFAVERAGDLLQAAERALHAAQERGGGRSEEWGERAERIALLAKGRRNAERDAQLSTVLALAEALDLRDADTANHSQTVGMYAELMARSLGLPLELAERVRLAGLLHDIGKIGIPDAVLNKPAQLTEQEWELMKQHPQIGERILRSMDAADLRSWIVAHHERPDGRGYPHGLEDADIPLPAKILAVADAYEAMTADRVYRSSLGHAAAREELVRCRGSQFDPEVVDAFLAALDELGIGADEATSSSEVAA